MAISSRTSPTRPATSQWPQPIVAAGLAVALLPALGLVPTHAGVTVRGLRSTPAARSVWTVEPPNRRAPVTSAMNEALVHAARQPGVTPGV